MSSFARFSDIDRCVATVAFGKARNGWFEGTHGRKSSMGNQFPGNGMSKLMSEFKVPHWYQIGAIRCCDVWLFRYRGQRRVYGARSLTKTIFFRWATSSHQNFVRRAGFRKVGARRRLRD